MGREKKENHKVHKMEFLTYTKWPGIQSFLFHCEDLKKKNQNLVILGVGKGSNQIIHFFSSHEQTAHVKIKFQINWEKLREKVGKTGEKKKGGKKNKFSLTTLASRSCYRILNLFCQFFLPFHNQTDKTQQVSIMRYKQNFQLPQK